MPSGYRVETAPNARAGCKNTECKKTGDKIQKGELRFGSLITVMEHTSWAYKHWGCVTPEQIKNVNQFLDGDMELLDGYEELSQELQEKVDRALTDGHVDDEDWKGDVEMNRPGKKGFRVKTPKKKAAEPADEGDGSPKPKKRARAPKDEDQDEAPAPKKARAKKAAAKEESGDAADVEPKPAKSKGRGKKAAMKEEDTAEEQPKPKKAKGKKAPAKEEVDEEEPAADVEAKAPKVKRGKKKTVAVGEEEKPVPQKKGRKKKAAADE